jgi:hypothetical protein
MQAPQAIQPYLKGSLTSADARDLLAMAGFAIRTSTFNVLSLIEQAPLHQAQFTGLDEESDAFLGSHWDLDTCREISEWAKALIA